MINSEAVVMHVVSDLFSKYSNTPLSKHMEAAAVQ